MRNVYYILRENEGWAVAAGATNLGPYDTRSDAIKAAVKLAADRAELRRPIEIVAQVEKPSTWERVWSSATEPAAAE